MQILLLVLLVTPAFGDTSSTLYINLDGTLNELPKNISHSVQTIIIQYSNLGYVDDIEPFPDLTFLELSFDNLTRFPNVTNVNSSLETLSLRFNEMDLRSGIPHLAVLKSLQLDGNELEYFPDLTNVSACLESLVLSINDITEVTDLPTLPKLLDMSLSLNDLNSFPNITNAPKLKYLNLEGNDISQVEGLPPTTALRKLTLSNNRFTEFPDLSNATRLLYVNLAGNSISTVEAIPRIDRLETLNLSHNRLDSFPNLTSVSLTLEVLDCSYNLIQVVRGLPPMARLRKLVLSHNRIAEFPDLGVVGATLEDLYLDFNDIVLIPTSSLASLPNLTLMTFGVGEGGRLQLANFCATGNKNHLMLRLYMERPTCNSEVLYMKLAMAVGKLNVSIEGATTLCAEPSELAGKDFMGLTKDDFIRTTNGNRQLQLRVIHPTLLGSWICPLAIDVKSNLVKSKCALTCLMQPDCFMFTVDNGSCFLASAVASEDDGQALTEYDTWYAI